MSALFQLLLLRLPVWCRQSEPLRRARTVQSTQLLHRHTLPDPSYSILTLEVELQRCRSDTGSAAEASESALTSVNARYAYCQRRHSRVGLLFGFKFTLSPLSRVNVRRQ